LTGVLHTRHYTVQQANATRGWVAERIERMRAAGVQLRELGKAASERTDALDPDLGGSYPGPEVARPLVVLSVAVAELQGLDIVVRDVERGLVDFPALRDGDEVYLCWLVDEPEVGHWHGIDSGFAGRRPL
jgi:hypothetical protein